ncbi:ribosomal protein 63, mitochondrial-like [Uloborus diversus]|uniref:ribosomal protein 63, mitochondrial-like n=1 Tax=Uloborus diversus TaxID=327109 RepID=UPI00240A733E|nr:ribosomal protein 63, mitochondrial-like [Uloborus diversus]
MRISGILCAYKFVKGIPGNIWIGKHRFVPPVTKKDRLEMWKRMMYEEEVMMYLNNPYVNEEDEKLYLEKHSTPQEKVFFKVKPPLKPLKDRTIADHLGHLNSNRTWGDHSHQ